MFSRLSMAQSIQAFIDQDSAWNDRDLSWEDVRLQGGILFSANSWRVVAVINAPLDTDEKVHCRDTVLQGNQLNLL